MDLMLVDKARGISEVIREDLDENPMLLVDAGWIIVDIAETITKLATNPQPKKVERQVEP